MKTEDLFKYGATPKSGENAGKRFSVNAIRPDGIDVYPWGKSDERLIFLKHGQYEVWPEQKTLFDDSKIKPTWGNLKKAMEEAGLPDDTLFAVHDFILEFRPAKMSAEKLRDVRDKEATYVIVE